MSQLQFKWHNCKNKIAENVPCFLKSRNTSKFIFRSNYYICPIYRSASFSVALRSQRMASIALSEFGCIDYLAYGAIFTRGVSVRCEGSENLSFWFPARKAVDERWAWGVVCHTIADQDDSFIGVVNLQPSSRPRSTSSSTGRRCH